jgi:hypothetical protein
MGAGRRFYPEIMIVDEERLWHPDSNHVSGGQIAANEKVESPGWVDRTSNLSCLRPDDVDVMTDVYPVAGTTDIWEYPRLKMSPPRRPVGDHAFWSERASGSLPNILALPLERSCRRMLELSHGRQLSRISCGGQLQLRVPLEGRRSDQRSLVIMRTEQACFYARPQIWNAGCRGWAILGGRRRSRAGRHEDGRPQNRQFRQRVLHQRASITACFSSSSRWTSSAEMHGTVDTERQVAAK